MIAFNNTRPTEALVLSQFGTSKCIHKNSFPVGEVQTTSSLILLSKYPFGFVKQHIWLVILFRKFGAVVRGG